jgi:hypothetical protein
MNKRHQADQPHARASLCRRFRLRLRCRLRTLCGAWGALALATAAQAASNAYLQGSFGPVVSWPLIPIHMVQLPDGRVLSYGSDGAGNQTGQFIYDVWDPRKGTGPDAHLTLPNTTGTDTFCSGQLVLPVSGAVLLTGGDKTVNGTRNYSVNDVNLFDWQRTTLYSAQQPMAFLRWYPTVLTTAQGEVLVLGGRADPNTPVATPEVYTEGAGWRTLGSAVSDAAYGTQNWSYPRAWVAPHGKVFIATTAGGTYFLDPAGAGQLSKTPLTLAASDAYLTSVMYRPGKILSFRKNNTATVIDLTGTTPTATRVTGVGQDRFHGSATVMADGQVYVNGGSFVSNVAWGVAYTGKIWNPDTRAWRTAATARQMRLYHSVSMLLPDGRVLTGGGGAPGPQTNLNAEVYTPPYLYKQDTSGTLAARPEITSAPTTGTWAQRIQVDTNVTGVSKVSLVKTGSVTHTVDFDQRYVPLSYTASGSSLSVTLPASANVAPPGYYLLFVFNSAGVPSVAKVIKLG